MPKNNHKKDLIQTFSLNLKIFKSAIVLINDIVQPFLSFINFADANGSRPGWVRNQLQNIFQPTDNKLAMKLFGSKKALVQERVRIKAAGHWIIHPCSSFR